MNEQTWTIAVTLATSNPDLVWQIRNEIIANLQSIRPLDASYQVHLPERREPLVRLTTEGVK